MRPWGIIITGEQPEDQEGPAATAYDVAWEVNPQRHAADADQEADPDRHADDSPAHMRSPAHRREGQGEADMDDRRIEAMATGKTVAMRPWVGRKAAVKRSSFLHRAKTPCSIAGPCATQKV